LTDSGSVKKPAGKAVGVIEVAGGRSTVVAARARSASSTFGHVDRSKSPVAPARISLRANGQFSPSDVNATSHF
jgi:hypothetical protein